MTHAKNEKERQTRELPKINELRRKDKYIDRK
jgi:hypothetical protein